MKKNASISTLLGVTQQDIATLLGVTRSQWSMYELGKRDLPLSAQQLLADMLVYVNASEAAAKSGSQDERQQAEKKQLELLLRENGYQQALTAKKMTATTKKNQAQERQSYLTDFLNARNQNIGNSTVGVKMSLAGSASGSLKNSGCANLVALQLKQEVLAAEQLLIEEKLRGLA